ncbi:MAG TPA: glycosyltransferase, partial [Micavibrio sp.]|nr:glycosyltransferase [Micavibrio sp.]
PIITQNNNLISYVGSVSDKAEDGQIRSSKCELLRNAKALMFPSCWAEPFGMVMPEAMACGTPVIGLDFKGSSVNEIVRNGINGFKFTREWEAAEIINTKLSAIDRHKVYNDFHSRFTTERMAQGYLRVYQEIRKHYMPEQVRARVTSRVGGFGLHVN